MKYEFFDPFLYVVGIICQNKHDTKKVFRKTYQYREQIIGYNINSHFYCLSRHIQLPDLALCLRIGEHQRLNQQTYKQNNKFTHLLQNLSLIEKKKFDSIEIIAIEMNFKKYVNNFDFFVLDL